MLPAVSTLKRNTIAAITAFAIALPAAQALAWGQREQDVLKGVIGTLAVQALIREAKRPQRNRPVVVQPQPQPVYVEPAPQYTSIYRTAAARAFNSYSSSERRLIQRRLSAYGYYRGGIDGSFGPGTYTAITAYARDEGQSLKSVSSAYGVYDGLIY